MSGPDFLIIGAMKSGTSTLAAQLGEWFGAHFRTKDARLHKHLG